MKNNKLKCKILYRFSIGICIGYFEGRFFIFLPCIVFTFYIEGNGYK